MSGESIQGFKKSEFANATPDRVFKTSDVQMEDLPEGVRLYIREKAVDLGTKKVLVNVYRLKDEGGLKSRRVWCGKMKANRVPEDSEIAEQFGGGRYIWILKWEGPDGKEQGIISEPVEVDEEQGREAHEAWKRRQAPADSTPAGPAPAAALPPPAAPALDLLGVIKIMEAAEEKTLARIERIATIFNGQKADSPADVLRDAYKGASEMIQRAVETNLTMAQSVGKSQAKALAAAPAPAPAEDETDAREDGPGLPPWLDAFMPHIEKGLGKLLDGGPVGGAVKTLILSSEEWQEIFQDKEKWGVAVAAMEKHFGSDKTGRALDILLNRRGKGKGK